MLYVTGITGHSGTWFVKRLIKENYQGKIRCLVRRTSDISFLEQSGLNIEFAEGDLGDVEFLTNSMQGIDTVLHIASITYSENVIQAAIANGVDWAILVHTTGRFSKYKSASKEYIRIEDEILEMRDRINITITRPTMIYGSSRDANMWKLINFLYRHKFFPMFGDGKNLMQPVHARDLGNAYFDILNNPNTTKNKEYDLSGKEAIEYIDLVQTVSQLLGSKNVLVKIPFAMSVWAAKAYNFILPKKAIISVEQVLRLQEDKAFSWQAAQRDFGYSPIDFPSGIREEINEFMQTIKM